MCLLCHWKFLCNGDEYSVFDEIETFGAESDSESNSESQPSTDNRPTPSGITPHVDSDINTASNIDEQTPHGNDNEQSLQGDITHSTLHEVSDEEDIDNCNFIDYEG